MDKVAKFFAILVVYLFLFSFFGNPCIAEEMGEDGPSNKQIGLGVVAGAMFPFANSEPYKITECWGFWVDIPIISTFHITPSTIIYRLDHKSDGDIGNIGITDLSLNFKFVIPFPMWKLWFAALMGASNGRFMDRDPVQFHVGGGTGFGIRVVANLDVVVTGQYKLIVDGNQANMNMIQALAGLQFNF